MRHASEFKRITDDITKLKVQKSDLLEQQDNRSAAGQRIQGAMDILRDGSGALTEWNESLIRQLVDTVRVLSAEKIAVHLRGGMEVEQMIGEGR